MIYLLGTDHSIQWEPSTPAPHLSAKLERFGIFIQNAAQLHEVDGIAEESSHEVEILRGKSIARRVAETAKPSLVYIPCEPSRQERKALGIPTDVDILRNAPRELGPELEAHRAAELLRYFPTREKFWIERLRQFPLPSILFVLGANHVQTFTRRLAESGIPWEIVSLDWQASDDQEYGALPLDFRPI